MIKIASHRTVIILFVLIIGAFSSLQAFGENFKSDHDDLCCGDYCDAHYDCSGVKFCIAQVLFPATGMDSPSRLKFNTLDINYSFFTCKIYRPPIL